MNFFILLLVCCVCLTQCITREIPTNVNNNEVVKNSSKFFTDQFKFWEEKGGFTKENIHGAKKEFWGGEFNGNT